MMASAKAPMNPADHRTIETSWLILIMPYRDPEKRRAYHRDYYRRPAWRERKNELRRARRLKNPDLAKRLDRKDQLKKYGLTTEQYDSMVKAQDGRCAICRKATRRMHVDHCHRAGCVRGLLCGACNRGIGHFSDDPNLLIAAAKYLSANQ